MEEMSGQGTWALFYGQWRTIERVSTEGQCGQIYVSGTSTLMTIRVVWQM